MIGRTVLVIVVGIIVFTWFLSFLISTYRRDFTSLTIVTPVLVTLIGIIFAYNRKNGNGR